MTTPAAARKQLRAHALKHPEAWADEPWPGDHVIKVGKKIFVFLGGEGSEVGLGVKLPRSLLFARAQTFVQKMGYGMDKSGWVAARFGKGEKIPLDLLRSWIDESYETVAATALPKRKRAAEPKRKPAAKRR
ncbi:MAG TPA: MmcQ/YjbR family DNA-binding protein [Methylomirabilota bacterium]|jgi:predicted DNA-binding protein (MmcQ/YjbR family)|nr:MmcQ/YjbR family DNA-binding protein [Methylomirabilota bacterium]